MITEELRIGNYVMDLAYSYCRVTGIKKLISIEMLRTGRKGDQLLEQLQPIPLTSKILERCGFEKDTLNEDIEKGNFFAPDGVGMQITMKKRLFGVRFTTDNSVKGMFDMFDSLPISIIQHLHQLQNLYFALTGEELKINFNVETAKG